MSRSQDPFVEPIPADEVRRAVRDVLARPEFNDEVTWWERVTTWIDERVQDFYDWLGELLDSIFGQALDDVSPEAVDDLQFVLWWVLAILLAGVGGWLFVRFGGRLPALRRSARAELQVSTRVHELRVRARAARAAGDLPLALRLTFFALVVGLGRRGNLEYRDAWTNRELLARGRPSTEVATLLSPLVDELDRKMFGRDETTAADVERLETLCSRWLGSEEDAA